MNILETIKNQVVSILKSKSLGGLNSVITHIERAEHFLEEGKNKNDEHLFTDVIYRTNHAFEGILKEAYKVITGNNSENKTPYQIENYFLENDVLNERVLDLFKNYRKEWRNTSTHDYNLFFDHSEAFLAIVSVSAFCHVLLNQIHEKVSFDIEKKVLTGSKNSIPNYSSMNLVEKITNLILNFSESFNFEDKLEVEIMGALSAYMKLMDNDLIVVRDAHIEPLSHFRPDFVISDKNHNQIVLENRKGRKRDLTDYLSTIMKIGKIKEAIVFYIPKPRENSELITREIILTIEGLKQKITEIYEK